ncbi:hypothetical protein CXG81DRAFT_25755 [Caulochytrium protostelioides]|uniref:Uncharacterized protein n=1 Tax=Caulochytrium protostelioides TaxID=1555241 RepID=A0A4P9X8D3_9FUNG|nr:hypothetical protein CXG81DRAFT_25755 [Caulochytrium protostelioides]|eukprot:RKP01543.1 hypothetical protein CXG81DRAFT_25755 [Caulochytrium protostelioides]
MWSRAVSRGAAPVARGAARRPTASHRPASTAAAAAAAAAAARHDGAAALQRLRETVLGLPPPPTAAVFSPHTHAAAQTNQLRPYREKPHTADHITPRPSRREEMLAWYPPDVDVRLLALQDPRLEKLELGDLVQANRIERELMRLRDGKNVRVSVLEGRFEAPQSSGTKKKRKKK